MFSKTVNSFPAKRRSSSRYVRQVLWSSLSLAAVGLLAGCSDHNIVQRAAATVELVNTSGVKIGTADLTENGNGVVTLVVNVSGLPAGEHGIHFHEFGVADPKASPPFSTAGEHYNPESKLHGLSNLANGGVHNGDLANITVKADGTASYGTDTDRITLTDGPKSLFDANGSALIIHANVDDQVSQPSGNSGGRIAGGVVVRK